MSKAIKYSFALLVGLALSYAAYLQYSKFAFNQRISTSLKDSSVRVTFQADTDIKNPQKENPLEYLKHIESDIAEIESKRVSIQVSATKANKLIADAATKYLTHCQDVLRALGNRTAKERAFLGAIQDYQSSIGSLYDAVLTPRFDAENTKTEISLQRLTDAQAGYELTYSEIRLALEELHSAGQLLAKQVSPDDLVDADVLRRLANANSGPRISVNISK